jgi:16S rRNA (uracil1498-N3)-methyltransferase
MAGAKAKIRLHVAESLGEGQVLTPSPGQVHYLRNVMRLSTGDEVLLFNGRDGEWLAALAVTAGKSLSLTPLVRTRPQGFPADIHLLFAPLKKTRTDMVVEKAGELGAACLRPVLTERNLAERVNMDRMAAQLVEAAEQCGATFVPALLPPMRLPALLSDWDARRLLLFCDETGDAPAAADGFAVSAAGAPCAILVGPEGGFSPDEAELLRSKAFVRPVRLGPRILRAETAAIAALTLWQALWGDWR